MGMYGRFRLVRWVLQQSRCEMMLDVELNVIVTGSSYLHDAVVHEVAGK